jgi:hypothetical protein
LEASEIPTQVKNIGAVAAFLGFELALFVSVFSWLRSYQRWLSYTSTIVVFVVIVLANVRDVSQSLSNSALDGIIVAGVGFGVPLTALLSGKLFVDIYRSKRNINSRSQQDYREALVQWDTTIQRAWKKYLSEPAQLRQAVVPPQNNATNNSKRDSGARERIRAYLEVNPDLLYQRGNGYKIERELGVSSTVAYEEIARIKQDRGNGE